MLLSGHKGELWTRLQFKSTSGHSLSGNKSLILKQLQREREMLDLLNSEVVQSVKTLSRTYIRAF